MTVDEGEVIDPRRPIPGDARLISKEIDRLSALRRCCQDIVEAMRRLDVSAWEGAAAARFDEVRTAQVRQWQSAESALDTAIDALTGYRDHVLVLQTKATRAVDEAGRTGNWDSTFQDIRYWRGQLAGDNQLVADRVAVVAHELDSVRRLVFPGGTDPGRNALVVTPVVSAVGPAEVTVSAPADDGETTQRVVREMIAERTSPEQLNGFTAAVCDGLLQATYQSIEQL